MGQVTPFRARGPLRTWIVGKPHGDRDDWFCSELVTESCVAAGLMDAATARPAATYPRDLFYGRSFNLYLDKHLCLDEWDAAGAVDGTAPRFFLTLWFRYIITVVPAGQLGGFRKEATHAPL